MRFVAIAVLLVADTGAYAQPSSTAQTTVGTPLAAPPHSRAPLGTPKEGEIRKLLDVTGQALLGTQVVGQLMDGFRQAFPKVPEQFWADFRSSVRTDEMTTMLVPIYDQHFSEDEIRELNTFYQTPLGQKLLKELPSVTQESMNAGQEWGTRLGDKLMKQLEAKGYRLHVPN